AEVVAGRAVYFAQEGAACRVVRIVPSAQHCRYAAIAEPECRHIKCRGSRMLTASAGSPIVNIATGKGAVVVNALHRTAHMLERQRLQLLLLKHQPAHEQRAAWRERRV